MNDKASIVLGTIRFTYMTDQEAEIRSLLKSNNGSIWSVFSIVWMQWPKKNAPDVVRLIEFIKNER